MLFILLSVFRFFIIDIFIFNLYENKKKFLLYENKKF